MCQQCVEGFSKEQILSQLEGPQDFKQYNTTSVEFLFIAASGEYGEEAEKIGLTLLRNFIDWRKERPDRYIPETGIEPMYPHDELEEIYAFLTSQTYSDAKAAGTYKNTVITFFKRTEQKYHSKSFQKRSIEYAEKNPERVFIGFLVGVFCAGMAVGYFIRCLIGRV